MGAVGVEPLGVTLFDVLTKRAAGGAELPGQATDAELLAWGETLRWDDGPDAFDATPAPAPLAAPAPIAPGSPRPPVRAPRRSTRRTLRARPLVAAPADRLD
jgi:hypothetical protein